MAQAPSLQGGLTLRHSYAFCALVALSSGVSGGALADDEENESYFEAEQGDTGHEPSEEDEDDEESDEERKERQTANAEAVREAVPAIMRGLGVYGGLILGAGGSVDAGEAGEDDLEPTLGFVTGVDYLLTRYTPYAAVGGELRLASFNTDYADSANLDRSWLLDLAIKPRGRYAFNDRLEAYLTLPFGLSYVMLSDDLSQEAGIGFNLGIGPGATFMISELFGVNLEALYLWHWYESESSVTGGPQEINERLGQVTFFASVMMKL